jgi:ribose 5-phosphate isomerase B
MIFLGSDHAGLDLKAYISSYLMGRGLEVEDLGVKAGERGDYPVYGSKVGRAVVCREGSVGIVFCGSGVGVSIAAGKVPGVRCVVCSEPYSAAMAKKHNDANVLALGQRVVGVELAALIVDTFLASEFERERHVRRVDLISQIEGGYAI